MEGICPGGIYLEGIQPRPLLIDVHVYKKFQDLKFIFLLDSQKRNSVPLRFCNKHGANGQPLMAA